MPGQWFTFGFWVFVLNGLIHPMLSMRLAFEATARTGATVAATFSATTPIFAATIAVVFLGESVNPTIAVGTLCTVFGIATLSWNPGAATRIVRVALLLATGRRVPARDEPAAREVGLDHVANVFLAAFVAFAVSATGTLVSHHLRTGGLPRSVLPAGARWFVLGGVLMAAAVGCMYGALSVGSVVVVAPIVAAYPLFALLASVTAGDERMTGRLLAGVVLVVAGVVSVSVGKA